MNKIGGFDEVIIRHRNKDFESIDTKLLKEYAKSIKGY
jgi:hypothetical protein